MPESTPSYPQFMQNSHDDGSSAALRVFFMFLCMWEIMYHVAKFGLKICLKQYPRQIMDSSLFNGENKKNSNGLTNSSSNGRTRSPLDDAKHTLLQRGPSYVVSFLHSIYVTGRGIMHLYHLWNATNYDKLLIPGMGVLNSYRWAHLEVARTNTLFLSYLIYDLFHILLQYPKLGGVDTILHHLLFASCSVINGTYGLLVFPFGWLIVGEGSTIFLNIRWFLLKSGRGNSALLDKTNGLFASTFFMTRIGIYSAGVIHLFYNSLPELRSLPAKTGVPIPLLGLTCGCMLLGWALNIVWGYKILAMVTGKTNGKKQQ
mmetsp:Transcript_2544/g.5431  ORF Transcript_2544/g.5431 Transcript_2544/m.5431 type:complete len:316 (+) Transcript_2544:260-1207(+)